MYSQLRLRIREKELESLKYFHSLAAYGNPCLHEMPGIQWTTSIVVPQAGPALVRLRAEGMGECLTERRVAIGSEVGRAVVRLVGGAVRRPAEDALPIGRRELGVDVDRCKTPHIQASALQRGAKEAERLTGIDVGQVPSGALAAPLAKVAEAVLGEDHVGGNACVVADEAAVAATSLAVGAVRIATRAAPCTDTLKKCKQVVRV